MHIPNLMRTLISLWALKPMNTLIDSTVKKNGASTDYIWNLGVLFPPLFRKL